MLSLLLREVQFIWCCNCGTNSSSMNATPERRATIICHALAHHLSSVMKYIRFTHQAHNAPRPLESRLLYHVILSPRPAVWRCEDFCSKKHTPQIPHPWTPGWGPAPCQCSSVPANIRLLNGPFVMWEATKGKEQRGGEGGDGRLHTYRFPFRELF